MNYSLRREGMIEIAKNFSKQNKLAFKVGKIYDMEAIIIGKCKKQDESDCVAKMLIPEVINKYSFMPEQTFFMAIQTIFSNAYEGYLEKKSDPNYMDKIFSTLNTMLNFVQEQTIGTIPEAVMIKPIYLKKKLMGYDVFGQSEVTRNQVYLIMICLSNIKT